MCSAGVSFSKRISSPELYLVSERNRGASHPAQRKVPVRFSLFRGLQATQDRIVIAAPLLFTQDLHLSIDSRLFDQVS